MNRKAPPHTLTAFIVALLCAGTAGGYETLSITVEGVERTARVFPGRQAATVASPLLLAFHGRGDTEYDFARAVPLHEAWPEATVVYPRGTVVAAENRQRGWRTRASGHPAAELALVDALLAEVARRHRVDPDRRFVTGFSNGGRLTLELLDDRPCVFAGFAPVGAVSRSLPQTGTPRPVLYLFGAGESRRYRTDWARTVVALSRRNRTATDPTVWRDELRLLKPAGDGAPLVWSLYQAGHIWPHGGEQTVVDFFREFGAACQPASGSSATSAGSASMASR